MRKNLKKKKNRTTSRHSARHELFLNSGCFLKRSIAFFFASLFLLGGIWGVHHYYTEYLEKIRPGISLSGFDFSGLNRAAAREKLEDLVGDWEHKGIQIQVSENGDQKKSTAIPAREAGISYDVESTLSRFFDQPAFDQADVLEMHGSSSDPINPSVSFDGWKWDSVLDWIKSYERTSRNAELFYDETLKSWVLSPAQVGLELLPADEEALKDEIELSALSGFSQESFHIALERQEPEISTEELQPLYDRIQKLMTQVYRWKIGNQVIELSLSEHPDAIHVHQEKNEVGIDPEFLKSFLSASLQEIEREPGKVLVSEPVLQEKKYYKSTYEGSFTPGLHFDEQQLLERFLSETPSSDAQELPLVEIAPEIEMAGVGKLSLLARGVSSYRLAPDEDRTYNVRFGLSKYDGVVIPQGQEFSFNQVLGWVTYEAGWKPALAIFGGGGVTKVPGGGLCQVSTTMYRAVINAGLKVTDRKPHSLDVSYYQEYGYGIDSTVYPPEDIDLKFVNDTPGPILIHTIMDEVNKEVFVEFYGLDDGRKVEIREVVNRSVVLPNEVTYTEEIPSGMQEVLQRGRVGRYIEWEWNITRSDGSMEKRTIETLYPAAARVVRVGTGG